MAVPIVALAGVIGLAVAGTDRSTSASPPEPLAGQVAAGAVPDAPRSAEPRGTDSPTVISPAVRYLPSREHGTDGLMGRLPFGIAGDSPLVRAERRDKFIIDDIVRPSRIAPGPGLKLTTARVG